MILIVSSQEDFSTNEVIDWILYYQHPFLRLCQDDFTEIENMQIQNNQTEIIFRVKGKAFYNKDFKSVWYRRSWLSMNDFCVTEQQKNSG